MFNGKVGILLAIVAAVVAVGAVMFFYNASDHAQHASNELQLSDANFDAESATHSGVTLVDFWAVWCGPCREIAPAIEELSVEYKGKATVAKVDVDQSPNLAKRFAIEGIPLVVILKDGKEVSRSVGAHSKEEFKKMLDEALKK